MDRKRWLQGLGIAYVLLLLAVCWPGSNAAIEKEAKLTEAANTRGMDKTPGAEEEKEGETGEEAGQEKRKIALTFDDGPNASCTPVLLDGLKERGVHATFFLIGENIEKQGNDQIVRRIQEEGHLIGNHTYHHVEITRVSNEVAYEEIKTTNDLIESIIGAPPEYMRPPFGAWQRNLEEKIHVLPVLWTIDPLDWTTENVDEIVNKVVTEAQENDIILLHDCYKSSVKAALKIVDFLQAEGFEFVTVDQLILE